jgi:ketosteroid isomerase-like protein
MAGSAVTASSGRLCVPLAAFACAALLACAAPEPAAPAPTPEQLAAQAREQARDQVLAQLARYEDGIRRMDSATVASLFDAAGEIDHAGGTPIRGPMAIKTFLDSYATYRVVSHVNRARSTIVAGDRATQSGDYDQTVISPEGKSLHAAGTFEATWARQADGGWRLLRMHTEQAR